MIAGFYDARPRNRLEGLLCETDCAAIQIQTKRFDRRSDSPEPVVVELVTTLLKHSDIPHAVLGSVFVVLNRAQATRLLMRAGFRESTVTAGALVDPKTGTPVYLLQHSQVTSSEFNA